MQSGSGDLKFGRTEKLSLVKIPCKEAGFSMLVAIPRDEHEHIREYSCSPPNQDNSIETIPETVVIVQLLAKMAATRLTVVSFKSHIF